MSSGEKLPPPFVTEDGGGDDRQRRHRHHDNDRNLGSNDDYESYLVDRHGNEYEPYSLAWRYLGMYIDCDIQEQVDDDDGDEQDEDERHRFLEDGSSSDCERVLLWAAYVDPRYHGGTIGEYQFYDLTTGQWDKSICKTRRCARMDCHEPRSHYKLVGVFKETYGLVDWAEQLFKHEGYCVWDEDTYEFMQDKRELWPTYCIQLQYSDYDGNTLYLHVLPQPEGNITMGIFTDEYCTQVSSTTNFTEYVYIYYENYYGDSSYGEEAAASWAYNIEMWNEYMNTYKICQPCRAYNLNKYDQSSSGEGDGDGDEDGRLLGNDENDGEGEEEQWGYNCYDDAGYTNCNQCYKFEVKTDLEPASADDLKRASEQGSLLRIKVNGRVYGSGGFTSPPDLSSLTLTVMLIAMGMLVGGAALFVVRRRYVKRKLMELPPSFHESLRIECQDVVKDKSDNDGVGALFLLESVRTRFLQPKIAPSPSYQSKDEDCGGTESPDVAEEQQPVTGVISMLASIRDRLTQRRFSEDHPTTNSVELSPSTIDNNGTDDDDNDKAEPRTID